MTLLPEKRREIVAAARAMVGTPWHHQGRAPGPCGGVDCVGELVCVAAAVGFAVDDQLDYAEDVDPAALEAALLRNCDRISASRAGAGDVVRLWVGDRSMPIHAALLTGEGTIIHALRRRVPGDSKVDEEPFQRWKKHAVDFWRYRIRTET